MQLEKRVVGPRKSNWSRSLKLTPQKRSGRLSRPGNFFSARAGCRKRGPKSRSYPRACAGISLGTYKKNKIRQALPLFELFHGIDSLALAQDMERIAEEEGSRPRILLEVNLAAEASKHGFAAESLPPIMEQLLSLGRLSIEGLMAIPPIAPEAENSRPYFVALRKLRDELESKFDLRLPQLSMGMSGDYLVAVEEGATLVRVGTAIFGERHRTRPPQSEGYSAV